jgi:hypothetical protein
MDAGDHFKNGASLKSQMSRRNIKCIALFLAVSFLLQSCFTTRYVSNEQILMRNYQGATVDDVEYNLGKPDEVDRLRTGYAYTYYYHGRINRHQSGEVYERYMFDNKDNLRCIQSTNAVPKKYFSPGKTFGLLPGTILTGICVVTLIVISIASQE